MIEYIKKCFLMKNKFCSSIFILDVSCNYMIVSMNYFAIKTHTSKKLNTSYIKNT